MTDELIYDVLGLLAGLDTSDVNLCDNPTAYAIVEAGLREAIQEAIRQERERCIDVVMGERVDADATQEDTDEAYNTALCHAAEAIRARSAASG